VKDEDLFKELRKTVQYTITLNPSLHNRLEGHLQILKCLTPNEGKRQTWMVNAISEKILRENESQDISKAHHLSLKLNESTYKKLQVRMEEINKSNPAFSKKQWLIEAIEEKLETEKKVVQEKLSEFRAEIRK
jgi:uncharacterized protein YdiU (UPF0061 family)